MSDLFIGEMLVLCLLLPVLLRPFFRSLQRIEGISLLPLFALVLCVTIVFSLGFRLSFVPVWAFSLLVFISGLSRLVRLGLHLPTDLYSRLSTVYSGFLLLLFVSIVFSAIFFAPEQAYMATKPVRRTVVVQQITPAIRAQFTVLAPAEASGDFSAHPVVILAAPPSAGAGGRNTLAWILAENGTIVVEADFWMGGVFKNPLYSVPVIRKSMTMMALLEKRPELGPDPEELELYQIQQLHWLLEYVQKSYGMTRPVYVIAEGSSVSTAMIRLNRNPGSISGLIGIVDTQDLDSLPLADGQYTRLAIDSGLMPGTALERPVLLLTGDPALFYGFGELGAEDVLAAMYYGGSRDSDRKIAELTGRRIATWLELRRGR